MAKQRVLIMGAAGRDFHNFNMVYRENPDVEVVAFTATQIPDIAGRTYPPELAGEHYPKGIPIHPEDDLLALLRSLRVDIVDFAYSDVSHETVMHKASMVLAAGADFRLLGTLTTQLRSTKPVVSVCAVRTGCGKSQTSRRVADILRAKGNRVVAIRHPMPYGNLVDQKVQRFASPEDLRHQHCTIEEREEYEPYLSRGMIVYAGVDYQCILQQAEQEADIILWDGGNNDLPFIKSDYHIVVADPLRPGHESSNHPGEANARAANLLIINKIDSAAPENILAVRERLRQLNPNATIIEAASPLSVEDPAGIRGKKVLVVEDGPTLTHGGMPFGAAFIAAQRFGASEIVDPKPHAVGSIQRTFEKYPHTGPILPAMGYSPTQLHELAQTIQNTPADLVLIGTPIDLAHLIKINKPTQRVQYELQEIGHPTLDELLIPFFTHTKKTDNKS
jgi:predicted GTPase